MCLVLIVFQSLFWKTITLYFIHTSWTLPYVFEGKLFIQILGWSREWSYYKVFPKAKTSVVCIEFPMASKLHFSEWKTYLTQSINKFLKFEENGTSHYVNTVWTPFLFAGEGGTLGGLKEFLVRIFVWGSFLCYLSKDILK